MRRMDAAVTRQGLFARILGMRETALIIFILLLVLFVSLRSPYFFTLKNFTDILLDTAILMILSLIHI